MESGKRDQVAPVEMETPDSPRTSTNIRDYADISHQKGDVRMVTTTKDKLEMLLSASGSLSANFFALMVGSALTVFMALKSGGIEESWRQTFWLAFLSSLILCAFFGLVTARDEYRKYQFRKEIRNAPSTPLR